MVLYGVVGVGGSGREIMPLVRHQISNQTEAEAVFVVEDHYQIAEEIVNGHRVVRMSDFLSASASARYFSIAIADSRTRERIANSIPRNLASPISVIAPTHVPLDGNAIGEGAVLCSFSHITSNVKVGRYFHLNYFSSVSHDCVIGDFVTFSPGVRCNGHVIIDDHVFVGAGAVIRDATKDPVTIGKGAVIGMGAVVTKSVPAGATVIGNPARPLNRNA